MNVLEEWTRQVCAALEVAEPDRDAVLLLARDVAHGVARPAAPLTTFLAGLAAGAAGDSPEARAEADARVRAVLAQWPAPDPGAS